MHATGVSIRSWRRNAIALATLVAAGGLATSHVAIAEPAPDFTLRQVLGAPFASELTPAPTAGRVAWVAESGGTRNVWIAEGPRGRVTTRAITKFTGDKGFDLGELTWDPSGRTVVFTRGGTLGEGGEEPVNTLSLPSGPPPQTVWAAPISGGDAVPLGAGHAPRVSPKGGKVAFLLKGQIWIAPLSASAATQATHNRGEIDDLVWSPDGGRLAFVSRRADHALIGVLDLAAQKITWMEPSFDSDMAPVWSPDGRKLAFVRIQKGGDEDSEGSAAGRTGLPWSIWVCDPTTGRGTAIWTADRGTGSVFHPIISRPALLWGRNDQLIFPWEKTGWVHLYAVSALGGAARELTTGGQFEVFNTFLSLDRRRIVYSSNAGYLDGRHIWEVAVSGGPPHRLTSGSRIEDYPVIASDGRVFALASDGRMPIHPVEVHGSRLIDLDPTWLPADFPLARLVAPQVVTFAAPDGLTIHGQLFLPPRSRHRPGPAVLFFHGGPMRQMLPAWHPMLAYTYMYGMNQYLANEGYVVLSVNWRGGIGYGLDFRRPERFTSKGASELNDILGAVQYLRSRSDVDPRRIGSWGASYGGYMTALALSRASNLIAAGVDYAGIHDLRLDEPALSAVGAPPGAAQLAYASSPIATVSRWRSPVLVAACDDDRNVSFDQSVELVRALREHGVEVEQYVIPDEIHDMLRQHSWLSLFQRADEFFGRRLMKLHGSNQLPASKTDAQ